MGTSEILSRVCMLDATLRAKPRKPSSPKEEVVGLMNDLC